MSKQAYNGPHPARIEASTERQAAHLHEPHLCQPKARQTSKQALDKRQTIRNNPCQASRAELVTKCREGSPDN